MKMRIFPILVNHGRIISVTVEQPVTTLPVWTRPRPMRLFWFLESDVQCEVFKHLDKAKNLVGFCRHLKNETAFYDPDTENLDLSMTVSISSLS